jgi:hypothetical protein
MRKGILLAALAVSLGYGAARSQSPGASDPRSPQAAQPDPRPALVLPPLVVAPIRVEETAQEPPRSVAAPQRSAAMLAPASLRSRPAVTDSPQVTAPLATSLPPYEVKAAVKDSGQAPDCLNCTPPERCRPRVWGSAEYLLWWLSPANVSPLVTTGNPGDAVPGALGQAGTRTLFGNGPIDYGSFSGMRVNLGYRFGENGCWSVESSGFLLEHRSVHFAAASDAAGNPPLYVPVTSAINGEPGSYTIADPILGFNGNIDVASSVRLWGADLNIGRRLSGCRPLDVDLLCGLRYLDLQESLNIASFNNDQVFDIQRTTNDHFATRNQFYGGQFGGRLSYQRGRFSTGLLGLVALGSTHQVVDITGSSTLAGSGAIAGTNPGGILTQPSNIGRQTHEEFTVVPQIQLKVGCDLTHWLRATVGYDFLYWNRVVRPGDQIDRTIDTTQVDGGPPALRPAPQFNHTDFFAHGVSFGLELCY